MKKIFLPLIALSLLSSCEEMFEKTIEYEIPQEPSKITIDSKIIAGDSVFALVGTTVYSMSNKDPELDFEASLRLYEDGNFLEELTPTTEKGYYSGRYTTRAGHTYSLEAQRDGYTTAFGSTELKQPVVVNSAEAVTSQNGYRLSVSFNDPPQAGDYYFFTISLPTPWSADEIIYFSTIDPTVEVFESFNDPFSDEGTSGTRGYLSDQYFNGKEKKLQLNLNNYYFEPTPDSTTEAYFNLYRISEDYYLHKRSVGAYSNSDGIFGEPVQIYSNVINGYGIVGGASGSRYKFSLKN